MSQRQTEAFKQASTNCLTLIPGPPGTGKTATAAWNVDSFARHGSKILLTSGPNAAIDDVCAKFDATTMQQLARYIAESAEEKLDPSLHKLYANRLFPKEAEKALLALKYDPSANKWRDHLKKCMEELQDYRNVP